MAEILVPMQSGSAVLTLEKGVLVASERDRSPLPGGVPAVDLFEKCRGDVSQAVEYLLNISDQGGLS